MAQGRRESKAAAGVCKISESPAPAGRESARSEGWAPAAGFYKSARARGSTIGSVEVQQLRRPPEWRRRTHAVGTMGLIARRVRMFDEDGV